MFFLPILQSPQTKVHVIVFGISFFNLIFIENKEIVIGARSKRRHSMKFYKINLSWRKEQPEHYTDYCGTGI